MQSAEDTVFHVGMDVHKETIVVAVYRNWQPEPEEERTLPHDFGKVGKLMSRLMSQGLVRSCYEAGCCGFGLHRRLTDLGVACTVVAPSMIPKRPGDRCKTDRRDAQALARYLRNGELRPVRVPTEADERDRDLVRCRGVLKREVHRSKQHVLKLLLRRSVRYEAKPWTQQFTRWLAKLQLEGRDHLTLQHYRALLDTKLTLLGEVEEEVRKVAQEPRWADVVGRLRCLRGIDMLSAITLATEIGDARRFHRARQLMGYVGLEPTEYSSGETQRRGGISKAGSIHCRRVLVESAWHYRHKPEASEALKERWKGQRPEVVAHARRALRRLSRRMYALSRRKDSKTAATAVARELVGYVWALMIGDPALLVARK